MLAKLKALFQRDVTGTKPGIATSEFWLSLITGAVTLLVGYHVIPSGVAAKYQGDEQFVSTAIAGIIAFGYSLSRGITKKGAGGAATALLSQLLNSSAYENAEPKVVAVVNSLLDAAGVTVNTLEAKIPASGLTTQVTKPTDYLESHLAAVEQGLHEHLNKIAADLAPKDMGPGDGSADSAAAPVPPAPPAPVAPDTTLNFPSGVADQPVSGTVGQMPVPTSTGVTSATAVTSAPTAPVSSF